MNRHTGKPILCFQSRYTTIKLLESLEIQCIYVYKTLSYVKKKDEMFEKHYHICPSSKIEPGHIYMPGTIQLVMQLM